MSDVALEDLRVISRWLDSGEEKIIRPASVADLVAALSAAEGVVRVDSEVLNVAVLVVPLEDE